MFIVFIKLLKIDILIKIISFKINLKKLDIFISLFNFN